VSTTRRTLERDRRLYTAVVIERMVEHTDSPKGEATKHLEAFTTTITEALKAGEEV
jgi:nucleoid DNA-binding protein